MDELHQQTISLLSFQSIPKETYDAQVAFNLLPVLGEAAKVAWARPRRGFDGIMRCSRAENCRR